MGIGKGLDGKWAGGGVRIEESGLEMRGGE